MKTLIYFCFFSLILTAAEGCKDDANPITSNPQTTNSVTLVTPNVDTTFQLSGNPAGMFCYLWTATGNPNHYTWQVSLDASFVNYTFSHQSDTNAVWVNFYAYTANTYYWRVWAIYGSPPSADSVVSATRRFFVVQ
jgi:hypothetical protein